VDKRLRAPFPWVGGKYYLVDKLLPLIPKHHTYVEVFGGAANLLLAKEPSPVEVYNDIDSGLVNFFRVIRDKEKFPRFYEQVMLIPYSREEFYCCAGTWRDEEDDIVRAVKWFVAARQCFGGVVGGSWGYGVTGSNKGMAQCVGSWLSSIELLPEVSERFRRVQVEHNDFRKILKAYDTEETFFYLDPPYVLETRRGGEVYSNEMTLSDHEELVNLLLHVKGNAMLSGYEHSVYKPLEEAGWTKLEFEAKCRLTGNTKGTKYLQSKENREKLGRRECVWLKEDKKTEHGQLDLVYMSESRKKVFWRCYSG